MKTKFKVTALSLAALMIASVLCSCSDDNSSTSNNSTSSGGRPGYPDYISSVSKDNYEYDLYKTYISITKYTGKESDVAIPAEIDGVAVTSIENRAFANNENPESIKSVSLPATITKIDSSAFYNSQYLEKIEIDENNKTFKSVDGVLYTYDMKEISAYPENKADTEFTVPEGITSIGNAQFAFCKNLTKINFPSTLKVVSDFAFHNANKLTEVVLPEGVEEVGSCAFYRCTSIQKLTFPSTIKTISDSAFVGCTAITSVEGYSGTSAETIAQALEVEFIDLTNAE